MSFVKKPPSGQPDSTDDSESCPASNQKHDKNLIRYCLNRWGHPSKSVRSSSLVKLTRPAAALALLIGIIPVRIQSLRISRLICCQACPSNSRFFHRKQIGSLAKKRGFSTGRFTAYAAGGRVRVNVVPFPSSLLTSISPWCVSIIDFVMASPRPVPLFLSV